MVHSVNEIYMLVSDAKSTAQKLNAAWIPMAAGRPNFNIPRPLQENDERPVLKECIATSERDLTMRTSRKKGVLWNRMKYDAFSRIENPSPTESPPAKFFFRFRRNFMLSSTRGAAMRSS